MPLWLQVFLGIVGGTGLLALITRDLYESIKRNSKKHKEREQQERLNNIKSMIKEEVGPLREDIKTLKNGSQASLRNDILLCYYRCEEKGYKTEDDAENFRDMYEAYHNLNGNSFIDNDIVPAFNRIELKPNNYRPEQTNNHHKNDNRD